MKLLLKLQEDGVILQKGIEENSAEIIVADGNFHGRTTTIVGFSSEADYKKGLALLLMVLFKLIIAIQTVTAQKYAKSLFNL